MITAIRILFARRAYRRTLKHISNPYGSYEYAEASIEALATYMRTMDYHVPTSARP